VRETRIENEPDMLVIERIEHLAAIAARLHEVRRAEDTQLVAHHLLFQVQFFGDVVHRDFAQKHQVNDADARSIAKELEEFRKFEKRIERHVLFLSLSSVVFDI
jgi:hypothetical protein